MTISNLEPNIVWKYFNEICKIPRLSKNEERIRKYLKLFAIQNKLHLKEDEVGNILIVRKADNGYENRKTVVLQSHLDMVGEKNSDTIHDWANDPIKPIIDGEWVTANVTTLGADDGIGVAAQMAILTDKSIKSGKIECLFTVDEETGMTGAINLKPNFFESKILLNLDSEDEGELFIGCAGGIDTVAQFDFETKDYLGNGFATTISLQGLHGGHSGDEIHKGYANSVKLINRVLLSLNDKFGICIAKIDAGNLRNAIPREASTTIIIDKGTETDVQSHLFGILSIFKTEFIDTEANISLTTVSTDTPKRVLTNLLQESLLKSIELCPHGVIAWSKTMESLVETSTNLASVKIENGKIQIVSSQRSSVDNAKNKVSENIKDIFKNLGAKVSISGAYPGWKPNIDSEILKITEASYKKLFGKNPIVRAIHAGLECGLILEKYPKLDMISFGPTIKGAHTPQERINIETTMKFWKLLLDVIDNIPESLELEVRS